MVQDPVSESLTGMQAARSILIIGGGTAGWLTAAYIARFMEQRRPDISITLLESPEIGPIGVGEGAFPTIRATLRFLGIDETQFIRAASATFKQGVRFDDWLHAPQAGHRHRYLHPFEPPFHSEGVDLAAQWVLRDPRERPSFAQAVTIQHRVAEAGRGPKMPGEGAFDGPLSYAYHFDARKLGEVLADRARSLGVTHLSGTLTGAVLNADGMIDHVLTREHGALRADLFIDCSGFRAELIAGSLGVPFVSMRDQLFTNRAVACRMPYERSDTPLATMTIATAHEAGWTWDIGLSTGRGVGTVYSSDHLSDEAALAVLASYTGSDPDKIDARVLDFHPGYRAQHWVGNCVAVGLAGGFLEPLESTGLILIEAAVAMIAELFPHHGPLDAPAGRFNALMTARYEAIADFLKLHYCLSRREERFWRENTHPASISVRLRDLLELWRHRPPNRFDFTLDVESFAFFNYQYILYGMGFAETTAPNTALAAAESDRLFRRLEMFGAQAAMDLPSHRELISAISAGTA